MGDARYNMGNSLMIACTKLGMHFVACTTTVSYTHLDVYKRQPLVPVVLMVYFSLKVRE